MDTRTLDGQDFVKLVSGGAANLQANADIVNDLNVFPIPDGDTGENMSMTISGGLRRMDGYDNPCIGHASEMLADGMLMSARGNSGVILSQLFAGIAAGLKGKETADVKDIASALRSGVKYAYNSVVTPTEGTILTVARDAIEYAAANITENSTLQSFGEDYIKEMEASLRRTPELLSVLKEAGVIDSGGAGLFYIADGIMRTAYGEEVAKVSDDTISSEKASVDLSSFNENSVMKYGYCTEFLLQLQTCKTDVEAFEINDLIDFLLSVGDSVVAFKTGTVVKVHVHTMTPGAVLEHCQQYGEFLTLKIENMTLQHSETIIKNRFDQKASGKETDDKTQKEATSLPLDVACDKEDKRKAYALVAVASGEGIKNAFLELGADYVIDGGQGKNPSTEDFISAFGFVNADTIFVLTSNSNIIMAAKQAAELYDRSEIHVIESRNIGESYAALTMLSYDSEDTNEIIDLLNEAMQGVVTGMVTRAVRDTNIDGIDIHKNDYMGLTDKKILSSCKEKNLSAETLLDKLEAEKCEILIVIYGKDVEDGEKRLLSGRIKEKYPRTELYEIDGGQEVYDYLMILQ